MKKLLLIVAFTFSMLTFAGATGGGGGEYPISSKITEFLELNYQEALTGLTETQKDKIITIDAKFFYCYSEEVALRMLQHELILSQYYSSNKAEDLILAYQQSLAADKKKCAELKLNEKTLLEDE